MSIKVYRKTFNTTGLTMIAPAVGGRIYYVVGFSAFNNESVATDDTYIRIHNGVSDLYGGSSGAMELSGRGCCFFLPFSVEDPYLSTGVGNALYIYPSSGKRIGGIIYFTVEDT